jgi:maltose alpha-D-glucosyltransferase/alpha-amylase
VLHTFVPHETTAWRYTVDAIGKYFDVARLHPDREPERQAFGAYLDNAGLLGRRTAELHIAVASDTTHAGFSPEPFTDSFRLSMYHSLLYTLTRCLDVLRSRAPGSPDQDVLQAVLAATDGVRTRLRYLRDNRINAMRIRVHGSWHLGQALFTGRDFAITDFEGDNRALFAEHRKKRSPLRDVSTMLLSLRRASTAAHVGGIPGVIESSDFLDRLGEFWYAQASKAFLDAYRATITSAGLLPVGEEFDRLLEIHLIEAALTSIERTSPSDWILPELRTILSVKVASD